MRGVWRVACGVWRAACGVRRAACSVRRAVCGVRRAAQAGGCALQDPRVDGGDGEDVEDAVGRHLHASERRAQRWSARKTG